MKKIILFVALVLGLQTVQAQINNFVPYRSNVRYLGLGSDSSFYIPTRDTTFIPFNLGFITRRPQDSLYYVGIKTTAGGKHWDLFANWIGAALFDTTVYHSTNYHNSNYPRLSGSYSNPSWITALAFSKISGLQDTIQKLRDSINARLRTSQAIPFDTTGAANNYELYLDRTGADTIKTRAATGGGGTFSVLKWRTGDENAPAVGDTLIINSAFRGMYGEMYRGSNYGYFLESVVNDTGFTRVNDSTFKVKPAFAANEWYYIRLTDSSALTQITLENHGAPPPSWTAGTFTTDNGWLTNTSGVWTSGAGGFGGYAVQSGSYSGDLWLRMQRPSGAVLGILGFDATSTLEGNAGFDYAVYFDVTGALTHLANGSGTTVGYTLSTNHYVALHRAASGTVTIETSPDGTTWTVRYTFGSTTTSALYLKINPHSSGGLYYPMILN